MPSTPIVSSPVTIFLVVLALILVVPLVLRRLRVPYVIGLILAGVAVGPHGFHILDRDMSFEVFGQVGLLYLMFLAGLEIDRYHLKQNLRRGIVFGSLTFALPLVAGMGAASWLLGMGPLASALMASMFAAHTLLAYPIASRFGLTRSVPVVIAVAGTIFTVLGSLIVLAAVGNVARLGEFNPLNAVALVAVIVAFTAAVAIVYPPVTRWFFRRNSDGVAQFIYILAMTFLAAAIAKWIGIEGVFGAFLGGLTLNRFVPARSPLMSRLEFVGNAIFIPYFLIGVGMLIDLNAVMNGWDTLYVAAVMSAVAMATKWLSAWITQRMYGLSAPGRSMLYQLTNAHTAVALAVVTIGWQLGLFDARVINATVIMILVTCTVSSVGAERAARRLKVRILTRDDSADSQAEGIARGAGRTLITLSNPVTARRLTELAMLMRGDKTKDDPASSLYALNVRNDNSPGAVANAHNALEEAVKAGAAVDTIVTPLDRYDNNVVTGVLHAVNERRIDTLILGLHRRTAFIDTFLGPKIEQLIASTNKMVVISRCLAPVNTMRRMVVCVPEKAEFETGFNQWVNALCTLAQSLGCRMSWHLWPSTLGPLQTTVRCGRYAVDMEWHEMTSPDDFILLSNTHNPDDDLFVVVTARRASVSFHPAMDEWPTFLQRYYARTSILMVFPRQFGDDTEAAIPTMSQTLAATLDAQPLFGWLRLRRIKG